MEAQAADLQAPLTGDFEAVRALLAGDTRDPHAILGAHGIRHDGQDGVVVRAFLPQAREAAVVWRNKRLPMDRAHDEGLFVRFIPDVSVPFKYQLAWSGVDGTKGRCSDPYTFGPTLGELDLHLAGEGTHYRLYEKLGAHLRRVDGTQGTSFAVWAPNAKRVSVVGPFNEWDGRRHPMRLMGHSGIWELFIPAIGTGEIYKYEIKTTANDLRLKTDPVAFQMELRPKSASVVCGLGKYTWSDGDWMKRREKCDARRSPMAIYEVHLGSWMRSGETGRRWLTYREVAPLLVQHCTEHGFTHLELLPVSEHAFDPSWGYQTTGYFAPTSRFGGPDDLRFLVDLCHQNGIAVLLDWVPAHFPKDDFALRWFDGTHLYEHGDPREGEHPDWGTLIFNYGRNEVRAFLLSNAMYWLNEFHFDGLRVDAVASMIYRDYSREGGDWIPNQYGGRENLEAISFLQELNTVVYAECPGAVTMAEESTAWPGVSQPVYLGGLGFGFKWNMGWMHDSLRYLSKEAVHRSYHHNELTFSMLYAWTENFILPLSHDEVVHGKGSLINKMPGDDWQKMANLRLLLCYMYAHPGKKLLFMGNEFGQPAEWNEDKSLDWHLLEDPRHAGLNQMHKDLGQVYLSRSALWALDCDTQGFQWIDCADAAQSIIVFNRRGPDGDVVCVFNFTPVVREGYRIGVPREGTYEEILNTDAKAYGGSNVGNSGRVQTDPTPYHGMEQSLTLALPPLGGLLLERSKEEDASTSQ